MQKIDLLGYTDFKSQLSNLEGVRTVTLLPRAVSNRKIRDFAVETKMLQNDGTLLPDEVAIPKRTVDNTIGRNMAQYEQYLRQPQRLILLKDPKNPLKSFQENEIYYTNQIKRPDWDTPFMLVADSGELHGLGFMEVIYDPELVFPVAFEFVRYEDIIYDKKTRNHQRQAMIARHYEWNADALQAAVEDGFSQEVVDKLVGSNKDIFQLYDIYKVWFKVNGKVNVAWASCGGDDFLKTPAELNITGEVETQYPLEIFRFRLTEDDELNQAKGRAFLDKDNQEAITQLWQGCVNGNNRASKIYFVAKNPGENKSELAKVELKHGCLMSIPMDMFQPAYPNPGMLATAQAFEGSQLQESGQPDYAVLARPDTRKTAEEIRAAQALQNNQVGKVMANYSRFFRKVHTLAWSWVQALAQQNKIDWVDQIVIPGVPGLPPIKRNPQALLAPDFQVFAAGDFEFIRRQELETLFAQFGDVFKGTPVGKMMTYDLLLYKFPEAGSRYAEAFAKYNQTQDQAVSILNGLIERIQANPQLAATIPELSQIQDAAHQLGNIYGGSPGGANPVEESADNSIVDPGVGVPSQGVIGAG